jgi:hypothetical protein
MGEAQRRRNADKQPSIAAAWRGYQEEVLGPTAPAIQREECRLAFWAGAAVLFRALIESVDPSPEQTDADLARMEALAAEIDAFEKTFDAAMARRSPAAAVPWNELPGAVRLGDAPVEERYRQRMTEVVQLLDQAFNGQVGGPDRETGFVLMVFPFGEREGRCNYASNGAARADIVALMREMISRFEGMPEVAPGHA